MEGKFHRITIRFGVVTVNMGLWLDVEQAIAEARMTCAKEEKNGQGEESTKIVEKYY